MQRRRPRYSLKSIDMKAYQQIVEAELKKHFETNPTLQKIRAGETVSETDLQTLVSLILTQSPNASRDVLAEFFSATAEPLQFAIRTIIGMDPEAVQAKSFKHRFKEDEQHLRWQNVRHTPAEKIIPLVRDEVFPHFKTTAASGSAFAEFMKDAQLMIQKPSLLVKTINMIHELPLLAARSRRTRYAGHSRCASSWKQLYPSNNQERPEHAD